MELSEKLRLLRYAHNYTREYVAYKLGISFKDYVQLESGENVLTLDQAKIVGELYQINVVDLAKDNDEGLHIEWQHLLNEPDFSIDNNRDDALNFIKTELASIKKMLYALVEKQDVSQ